jgi:hypothetical protein
MAIFKFLLEFHAMYGGGGNEAHPPGDECSQNFVFLDHSTYQVISSNFEAFAKMYKFLNRLLFFRIIFFPIFFHGKI